MLRTKATFMMVFLGALLIAGVAATAADDGERRVKIRRMIHCEEGEDCSSEDHNVIMLGTDGSTIDLKMMLDCDEGEGCTVAHRDAHMVFVGDDGEIHQLDGSEVDWVSDGPRALAMAMARGASGGGSFLGVQLNELTPELREHFGLGREAGVMIAKVVEGSPAESAGLAVGDIVTAVDGEAVSSGGALARSISAHEEGETVALEVWRGGQLQNIVATVAAREGMDNVWIPAAGEGHMGNLHRVVIACEGDGDCEDLDLDFDCGGAEECEVRVECDGPDSCECTVNGETSNCEDLPGFQVLHMQHGGHGGHGD